MEIEKLTHMEIEIGDIDSVKRLEMEKEIEIEI